MKNPGVWILGTPKDDDRRDGMGIVVEYANKTGQPRWIKPAKHVWDYTLFGDNRTAAAPDEVIPMAYRKNQRRHGRLQPVDHQRQDFDEKAEPQGPAKREAIPPGL